MKEELIRVLNNKLDDINNDIESLIELNKKISEEKENLDYVSNILSLFDDNGGQNVHYFSKIKRDDFDKILSIVNDETRNIFNTNDCNYDGLIYLINGINEGVSLSLTNEQVNGIKYLIDQLGGKVNEYAAALDGYELVKTRYEISDVNELNKKRDYYNRVISNLNNDEYVCDTDIIMEAANYSDLPEDMIVEMLTFVLEYNIIIYNNKPVEKLSEDNNNNNSIEVQENSYTNEEDSITFDSAIKENASEEKNSNEEIELENNQEENTKEPSFDEIFHFDDITTSNIETEEIEDESNKQDNDLNTAYTPIVEEVSNENNEYSFEGLSDEKIENQEDNDVSFEGLSGEKIENQEDNGVSFEGLSNENIVNQEEDNFENAKESIDNDFRDVIDEKDDYDEYHDIDLNNEPSNQKLNKLFEKYGIKETNFNELVVGNIDEYDDILKILKNNDILDLFANNNELLLEVLLNSNKTVINNVLDIIEKDLSVDKDDYIITTKIAINTIPSIFIKDDGNYDNFIENINIFKQIGINLINLFDFSKEVLIASNERITKNLDIVRKYGYEINYKNAKYLLLIPNIGDKIDYYVESIYEDKIKNEIFDGAEYIKDYAAKLNVVTDETIKRIRYASENGKKVFGSKPKSLSGEITNLKVNALDISTDYLNKFFDNEFATLTGDEVREYVKLIHNSSNVGNYNDELEILNPYLKGLRYEINGINISVNKVERIYNILRSYGASSSKALQFAVCYNLVITKDEYDKLKDKLDELGGNL